jgi:1-acyl-sn-glycerol-3-phosphate acyltransferase
MVMILPEGVRFVDGQLHETHTDVGLFACRSDALIVPCRRSGSYEIINRFSHFSNFHENIAILFGKSLRASEFDNMNSANGYDGATNIAMERIKALELPTQNILSRETRNVSAKHTSFVFRQSTFQRGIYSESLRASIETRAIPVKVSIYVCCYRYPSTVQK